VDKGVWKEAVGEDAHEEAVRSYDRLERGIYTKKRKGVSTVKRGEREGERICEGAIKKRLHPAI